MTDAELAAIESRLAPFLAGVGHAMTDGHDVLALLAEVRALRQPPDVTGLMPAAEVEALRKRLSALSIPGLDHLDAQAALVRAQYGMISDLLAHGDGPGVPAYERGRAEGREEAARAVEETLAALLARGRREGGRTYTLLRDVAAKVRGLGPRRPPLPPCESEARLAVAEAALRQCLERLEWATGLSVGILPAHTAHAVAAARKALGEDVGA